jgi:hypothetical protein
MRKKILDNIATGLETEIGRDSTVYTDLKIEDIQTRLPETVTVNYFIGIVIERAGAISNEIGRYAPSLKNYECMIVVFLKSGDYNAVQDELDTIVTRVTKYVAKDTGNLGGVEQIKDGTTERVVSFSIADYNYDVREMKSALGAGCAITLNIKTDLIIN